jgi:shikimate dehydrogenase
MKLYGLIGYPLTHSWSAVFFNRKFQELGLRDHDYRLFPLLFIHEMRPLIEQNPEIAGLNVTIPYKRDVLGLLDRISPEAEQIGAVNCISIERKGNRNILCGYNTDYIGFFESLKPLLQPYHTRALVLGSGGSSLAVRFALTKVNLSYTLISRKKSGADVLTYAEVDESLIRAHPIIINTTPLGMFPDTDQCPDIPYSFLENQHLLFDLVYNPEETLFLKKGRDSGAQTMNGIRMLEIQAEASWKIWNNVLIC